MEANCLHKMIDLFLAWLAKLREILAEVIRNAVAAEAESIRQECRKTGASVAELKQVLETNVVSKDEQIHSLQDALLREQSLSELDALRPLFNDLITLRDALATYEATYSQQSKPKRSVFPWKRRKHNDAPAPAGVLKALSDELQQTLARFGVQMITGTGKRVDTLTQRVVSTISTKDPEQDSVVQSEIRPGFVMNAKKEVVIRPQEVVVSVFKGA